MTSLAGVQVERDVPAPMRDGTTLRCDLYRPSGPGPHPVLLLRTPYDKTVAQQVVYQHPVWYARRGYLVVVQDVRGRYASEGAFDPYHAEAADGADTVAWASRLPGANGRVGMYGFSYAGAAQLLAATRRPAQLACTVPGFTSGDFYDHWTYVGGAFNLAFVVSWTMQMLAVPDLVRSGDRGAAAALAALLPDLPRLYRAQPLREFPPLRQVSAARYFFDWVEHDTRDGFWQGISIRERHDRIVTPNLHVGGWYDTFIEGALENYASLAEWAAGDHRRTQRLLVGPWAHAPWTRRTGPIDYGEAAGGVVDQAQLEWFDYWLKGKGSLDGPPVRRFVLGENVWRDADAWPVPGTTVQEWYLHASRGANSLSGDGTLSRSGPGDEPADVYVTMPGRPVPSAGGRASSDPTATPMGPAEQGPVEVRNDVLVYTTDPLGEEIEVTGTVWLLLHAASSARDTDWTAKLVDVDEFGRAINLCDGIVRARFRDSLEAPTPIEPYRIYEYRIRVGSTSNLFRRGHRIRLDVASSNFPLYDVNHNNGQRTADANLLDAEVATQAVFHDGRRPSRLLLPVVRRSG